MNRLTKAWKALRGTLEPEVVIADSAVVETVYAAPADYGLNPRYYATCQQAHEFWGPQFRVRAAKALKIQGRLFLLPTDLSEIQLQPKPKRPKGKATA